MNNLKVENEIWHKYLYFMYLFPKIEFLVVCIKWNYIITIIWKIKQFYFAIYKTWKCDLLLWPYQWLLYWHEIHSKIRSFIISGPVMGLSFLFVYSDNCFVLLIVFSAIYTYFGFYFVVVYRPWLRKQSTY